MHLDAMLALCETISCRRTTLLDYFGQTGVPCNNCDTCLTPPESWDGTVAAQKILSTVWRLRKERNQKFGAGQVIDILLGRKTAKVIQFDHDQLSTFGIGEDLNESEWRGVVRQLLAQSFLAVEGEYSTLVLTESSADVLGRKREVKLRKDPAPARSTTRAATAAAAKPKVDLPAEATPLFEALREWRAQQAREQAVPAYVIFHDATLKAIAASRPGTLTELGGVSGVGQAKLAKYGEQILEVVAGGGPAPAEPVTPAASTPKSRTTSTGGAAWGSTGDADEWPEPEEPGEPMDW
jgi:ATP-dependent DNA helicase RecQ